MPVLDCPSVKPQGPSLKKGFHEEGFSRRESDTSPLCSGTVFCIPVLGPVLILFAHVHRRHYTAYSCHVAVNVSVSRYGFSPCCSLPLCDRSKGRIRQFRCNYLLCEISVSTPEQEYDGCQWYVACCKS